MSYNIRTTLDVQDNLNVGLNANISGSLSVTGSIYGNLNGTATSASYVLNAVSSSFATQAISSSFASTASLAPNYLLLSSTSSMLAPYMLNLSASSFTTTSSFNSFTSSINIATSSFATTGSNIFIGNQTITGSLTVSSSTATQLLIGTNTLFASSSGNISVGTTSNSAKMQIRGTTSGSNITFRVENVNASASLTLDDVGTLVTPGRLFFGGNTAGFAWNVNGSATIQAAYGNESGQIELRPNGSSAGIVFSRNGNMGLGSPTFKFFSTPWTIFASGSVIVGDYGGFTNNTAAPAKFAISGSGAQTLVKIDSTTVSNILNISSSGLIVSTGSFNIRGDINLSTGSLTLTTGSVTMPNRSAFRVYGASLTGIPATTTISGSATTVDYNQGNNYNNTTGLYTAPVAGLYSVYYNGRTQSGATQQVIVYKNRVAGVGGTSMLMWETTGSNSGHFGVSSILNLAANDTLQAVVALGTIQFDSNDNWGAAFIG